MSTVAAKTMTAEEFYEWVNRPENQDKHCELERGEIVEITRPGMLHGFVCANVVVILWSYAKRQKKGYVCANDTGVVVERNPDTVRGPDVMYFEDAEHIDQLEPKFGQRPPVLAVEVSSPTDTVGKTNRKIREQLRFGTRLIWIIDPEARNIAVYRPGHEHYLLEISDELTGNDVMPDFRCPVAEFFAMPS